MSEELKLSKLDRIFLINQLRILEGLYPEEASDLSVQREALERGYEMLYPWGYQGVYDGDEMMNIEESSEVWDTMEMFDAIDRSLSEKTEVPKYAITKFVGYDGNNEAKFMAFARFTVERLERFEYLPMEQPGYWNSHRPVREIYQRMLARWKNLPRESQFAMNEEQLRDVLEAAKHSENR